MNAEVKEKIRSLVQGRIDANQTTKARGYVSTTPNGTKVDRIGMSVYLDPEKGDAQIEKISKVLTQLSEEGKAGNPDPILVKASGMDWVVVSCQLSTEENNYSHQPKVILADLLVGSNAVVSAEERDKSVRLLQEMRESNKSLRSQFGAPNNSSLEKVKEVTEDEFNDLLS